MSSSINILVVPKSKSSTEAGLDSDMGNAHAPSHYGCCLRRKHACYFIGNHTQLQAALLAFFSPGLRPQHQTHVV